MSESINNPSSEETIFGHALDLPVAERNAYLTQACAGDAALRVRVEALLQAHDDAGSLLDASPGGAVRAALSRPPPEEKPGALIGRYKLLQKIGEGGCGVVYLAEHHRRHPRLALHRAAPNPIDFEPNASAHVATSHVNTNA